MEKLSFNSVKKKGGHPRKYPLPTEYNGSATKNTYQFRTSLSSSAGPKELPLMRPRGRPPNSAPKVAALLTTGPKSCNKLKRAIKCGKCPDCMQPDCGKCKYCKDKKKFGGQNKLKQSCIHRGMCASLVARANGDNPGHNDVRNGSGDVESVPEKTNECVEVETSVQKGSGNIISY
mmetsp:Transcript_14329/g.27894  ORF Transcript_14329/g.27894 Transcript_14329/m.27894 type:complete len:176 (+) Transcript_14329:97-624(+)